MRDLKDYIIVGLVILFVLWMIDVITSSQGISEHIRMGLEGW